LVNDIIDLFKEIIWLFIAESGSKLIKLFDRIYETEQSNSGAKFTSTFLEALEILAFLEILCLVSTELFYDSLLFTVP